MVLTTDAQADMIYKTALPKLESGPRFPRNYTSNRGLEQQRLLARGCYEEMITHHITRSHLNRNTLRVDQTPLLSIVASS